MDWGRPFDRQDRPAHIRALVEHLEEWLRNVGIEGIADSLAHESRDQQQRGGHIAGGSSGHLFNVIPAAPANHGFCCPTVIAFAYGTRGRYGLGQVLQQLRAHLIECAQPRSGHATRTAIIIYDKEVNRTFWESKSDFRKHHQLYGVDFMRLHWDGNQLLEKSAF